MALEKLISKYPEFKFKCAEVKENTAPFAEDFFDVVVSIEVMEHVENLNVYLNAIYRVLTPGGIFIWTTPCANRFSIEHVFNVFTNQIEKTSEGYRRWKWEDPTHIRRMKSNEIKDKLQEVGFIDVWFRFRAHFFSYICTRLFKGCLQKLGERMMSLDYSLFRRLPNGASMLGYAEKKSFKRSNKQD